MGSCGWDLGLCVHTALWLLKPITGDVPLFPEQSLSPYFTRLFFITIMFKAQGWSRDENKVLLFFFKERWRAGARTTTPWIRTSKIFMLCLSSTMIIQPEMSRSLRNWSFCGHEKAPNQDWSGAVFSRGLCEVMKRPQLKVWLCGFCDQKFVFTDSEKVFSQEEFL